MTVSKFSASLPSRIENKNPGTLSIRKFFTLGVRYSIGLIFLTVHYGHINEKLSSKFKVIMMSYSENFIKSIL